MHHTGISVVIPNYNGRKLLPETLPPLFVALNKSGLEHEVIISDDCSTDDSVQWIKEAYSSIIVLENETNRGFSPTINKGIFATRYTYILLLNSDVKLTENYFSSLLRYFEREDCFGVMGRIIGWDDDLIQDAAKYPSFHGAKIKTTGNYYPVEPLPNDWLYSMYLSGANAFVSAEKVKKIGGFDEIFAPFYVEDYEMSLRAWRLGWCCYYDHESVCRHRVSVTIKSKSSKAAINTVYYRNKMFLHAMHLQGITLFLWYMQLIPETLIRILSGRFYYLRALSAFFAGRKRMLQSKQQFSALSKDMSSSLSVKDIVAKINSSISGRAIKRF